MRNGLPIGLLESEVKEVPFFPDFILKDSRAYKVAAEMKQKIQGLAEKKKIAEDLLSKAYSQGVEVSAPRFRLKESETLLVIIRDLTHSLSLEAIEEKVGEGETVISEVTEAGREALKEAKGRRIGLVIALFFVFILALGLFLKIRQMIKGSKT